MQMSKGVEWAVHAAALMAGLPERTGLTAEAMADFHGVPAAYMAKQMQALSKAGLITSSRGAKGGYRLAQAASEITLWDIAASIEGVRPVFRCTEIRQNGPCGLKAKDCVKLCPIAAAFLEAERVWRDALERVSLADIAVQVMADTSPQRLKKLFAWLQTEAKEV